MRNLTVNLIHTYYVVAGDTPVHKRAGGVVPPQGSYDRQGSGKVMNYPDWKGLSQHAGWTGYREAGTASMMM
jgi:hypothetical protein